MYSITKGMVAASDVVAAPQHAYKPWPFLDPGEMNQWSEK